MTNNILFLYEATQTFTNTVYDHISSFAKYSEYNYFFVHQDVNTELNIDLNKFVAIAIHYSIRLPYDQISNSTERKLIEYQGLKFLFIQDEYDFTYKTWGWIKKLGFQLVFTVVPERSIEKIYPEREFPNTKFVSILTGYVPSSLKSSNYLTPPSRRNIFVGYRGRSLPIQYGKLGKEKVEIANLVRDYCNKKNISNNISYLEEDRLYGDDWVKFLQSCRSSLGSESGSNVFDWDGSLKFRINDFKTKYPNLKESQIYDSLVRPLEIPDAINQISPRIFEAISAKSVLVLFEGNYSNIIFPNEHFIPLKKDGSNLDEVFRKVCDDNYVDNMTEKAFQDIIASNKYSYRTFVFFIDEIIKKSIKVNNKSTNNGYFCIDPNNNFNNITAYPCKYRTDQTNKSLHNDYAKRLMHRKSNPLYGSLNGLISPLEAVCYACVKYMHPRVLKIYIMLPESVRYKLRPISRIRSLYKMINNFLFQK